MTKAPDTPQEGHKFLEIYIADHLAGSAAGTRRIRRLADAERDGVDGPMLSELASQIAQERQALQSVADALGIRPQAYKQVASRVLEFAGLAKLNGRLLRRSPLSSLVELEGMLMAVRGKLAGWETLRTVLDTPRVGPVDIDELIARNKRQLEQLADAHARAAQTALGRAQAA